MCEGSVLMCLLADPILLDFSKVCVYAGERERGGVRVCVCAYAKDLFVYMFIGKVVFICL